MPEISQDAFEDKYPGVPPISPQELRFRANSFGNNKMLYNIPSENGSLSNNDRKQKLSECDFDSFHHVGSTDLVYGYKRESSHR